MHNEEDFSRRQNSLHLKKRQNEYKKTTIFQNSHKRFLRNEREKLFTLKRQKANEEACKNKSININITDTLREIHNSALLIDTSLKDNSNICDIDWNVLQLNLKNISLLFLLNVKNVEESLRSNFINLLKICLDGSLKYCKEKVLYESLCCIDNIALMTNDLNTEVIDVLLDSMNNVFSHPSSIKLKEHVAKVFENLVGHFANQIINSCTIQLSFQFLSSYGGKFTAENIGLIRALTSLISNVFRLLNENELIAHKAVYEWQAALILTEFIKLCATPLENFTSSDCSSLCINNEMSSKESALMNASVKENENCKSVVYHSVTELCATDYRRSAAGAALWAVAYLCLAHEKITLKFCKEGIVSYLLTLIEDGVVTARNFNFKNKNELEMCENVITISAEDNYSQTCGSAFISEDELLNKIMSSSVDILAPALNIISSVTQASLSYENKYLAETLVNSKNFRELLKSLLNYHHRQIVCEAAVVVANLAAGSSLATDFAYSLASDVAKLLQFPGSFDIKRQAAIAIVHICLNHDRRYLSEILSVQPAIIDHMIALLDDCKYDLISVLVALDFIEGVAQWFPRGEKILYEKGIIEKLEGVQFMHDESTERRIAMMTDKYFDELEDEDYAI